MSWTELKSPSPPSLLSPAGPYCFAPITPPKKLLEMCTTTEGDGMSGEECWWWWGINLNVSCC